MILLPLTVKSKGCQILRMISIITKARNIPKVMAIKCFTNILNRIIELFNDYQGFSMSSGVYLWFLSKKTELIFFLFRITSFFPNHLFNIAVGIRMIIKT